MEKMYIKHDHNYFPKLPSVKVWNSFIIYNYNNGIIRIHCYVSVDSGFNFLC